MSYWRVKKVVSQVAYEVDWSRRCLWATITGRPINCGTMDGFYYP